MPLAPDPGTIRRHWSALCETIGNRFFGTAGERRAAAYIESQFRSFGLDNVHRFTFEVPVWRYGKCRLTADLGGRKRVIRTAITGMFSHSTPDRGVTGDLVYLQTGLPHDFAQPTRGKVGLLIGSLSLGDAEVRKRVNDARLAALLVVDIRNPFTWTIPAGGAPMWMCHYRTPILSIAYYDAIALVRAAADQRVRLHVVAQGETRWGSSQHVIAEAVGTRRPEEVILVTAHYDCVWGNVGANDDASGTVAVLELARLFARKPAGRTLRFIAYGTEECLSVGAYLYARSLPAEQRARIVLALQNGSCGSHVGEDHLFVMASTPLADLARDVWTRRGHPLHVQEQVNAYSDHFPMTIHGVPSIWLGRRSIPGGYWNHHSVHDNLDHARVPVLARTIGSEHAFLRRIANAPRLPYPRRIAPAMMKQVAATGRRVYHHPWGPADLKDCCRRLRR